MIPVPFLWYSKVSDLDGRASYMHQENMHRAQLMVKYKTEEEWRVLVARFIVDFYGDFCGGLIVRSPQFIIRQNDAWNSAESFWYPGSSATGRRFRWEVLSNNSLPVPCLNRILDKDSVDTETARAWARKQMALAVFSKAYNNSRRLVHANGNVGGEMHNLVRTMQEVEGAPMLTHTAKVHGLVGGPNHSAKALGFTNQTMRAPGFELTETPEFVNPNSSRQCQAWCFVFERIEIEPWICEHCGWINPEWMDECANCNQERPPVTGRTPPVPDHIFNMFKEAYQNTDFTYGLTRTMWSNG